MKTNENMDVEYWETSKLIPYARNAKLHNNQQISQIAGSIKEFGFNDPVEISSDGVIIAGHGRVLAAQLLDIKEVPVIIHSHLSEPQRRAYTLLNNRLADIGGGWDNELLNLELDDLKSEEFDLSCFDEISFDNGDEFTDFDDADNSKYTQNIEAPTYEIKNEKPSIQSLVDYSYHDKLIKKIKDSNVTDEEKAFLLSAAERHSVFNFSSIADYYAHSNIEMQELMEDSALVIIDYNKAIENGFADFNQELTEQYEDAKKDE